jgi:hypothetical protein
MMPGERPPIGFMRLLFYLVTAQIAGIAVIVYVLSHR